MIFLVHREVDVLTEIERTEKRQKLRSESVCRIIQMDVEVAGDDEFVGHGCSKGEKRTEVIEEDREWFRMSGRRWRTIDIEDRYLRMRKLQIRTMKNLCERIADKKSCATARG